MSTRKRVSQACKICNQKKVKCDGGFPSCSTCQGKNTACSYGVSKRRGPNTRKASHLSTESLGTNIDRTTSAIRTANNPVPSNNSDCLSAVSPDTSKRLFQIYFDCIHPVWPLLYKPLYASLDFTSPSPAVPTPLILAIFAIASCVYTQQNTGYGNSRGGDGYPEPQIFFEDALGIFQQGTTSGSNRPTLNVFYPSITNCQVLVILALQQHGVAEYSRAAMLCGLAASMAIELRIHREYIPNDPVEREIRSRLWWNLYILEKMMNGEQGRPIILRSEETDCSWPSLSESDEFELMPPNLRHSTSAIQNNPIKMRTMSAFHTTIRLSIILERVYRDIYGIAARKTILVDQTGGEQLRMQLWYELQNWQKNLDASPLRLDLNDDLTFSPPIITNQVIMLTGTIMLNRPFVARFRSDLVPEESTVNPYEICLQAANRICVILEKYLGWLTEGPCDLVFSIFTAASILLQHSKQLNEDGTADETYRRLKQCIHWLSILGKSWKIAGARRQLLDDLFVLPQSLRELSAKEGNPVSQSTNVQFPSQPGSSGDVQNATVQLPTDQHQSYVDDWSFLKDFGDFTDQFYSWDVELRNLLNGQLTLEQETT